MVALARAPGCALHLAHATMNFGSTRAARPSCSPCSTTRSPTGADITLDTYPYLPGCTTLAAMLPSWARGGGPEASWPGSRTPRTRERIRHDLEVRRLGRLPRRAHRVGHHRDLRGPRPRARGRTSAARSPSSPRDAARPPATCPSTCWSSDRLGHDDPAARRPRGERPGDHAAPRPHRRQRRHPGGAQAAPARVRHLPALPRPLRPRAGRARPGGVRRPPHRPPGRPAAAARPRPGPRGLPRRPGPLRPGHGAGRPPSRTRASRRAGIPYVLVDGRP